MRNPEGIQHQGYSVGIDSNSATGSTDGQSPSYESRNDHGPSHFISARDCPFDYVEHAKVHQPNEEGVEQLKRPKTCELSERDNPDWPEGYTYLDRFLDEMKRQNNGEVLFVATTIGDYKVMAEDMQELRRYINQLGEVIIYYRNVTIKGEPAVGAAVTKNETSKDKE